MRSIRVLAIVLGSVALAQVGTPAAQAQPQPRPAILTGQVSGPDGAAMEGVIVSANMYPSTITVSVVTGADGRYSFPAGRLESGRYFLTIRAAGFELDGDGVAQLAAGKPNNFDLKLKKAHDLAAQLTNAEWLLSFPGTDAQKKPLLACTGCHTLERVARSTHTADEWVPTMERMFRYAQVSTPLRPQLRAEGPGFAPPMDQMRRTASFLATINLSATPEWKYELKTLLRVTGRGTRVVITEYGLRRLTTEPHDVILDGKGRVWYSDFGEMYFGSLDPATGKVTEYPVPLLRKGFAEGMLDLERDRQGNFWLGVMYQGGLAKFDPTTRKFKEYPLPKQAMDGVAQVNMVTTRSDVSGKVWTNNVGHRDLYRVDIATGRMQHLEPYANLPEDSPLAGRPHAIYGLAADSQDNAYILDFAGRWIGRIDGKTGQTTFYQTPTDNSWPRRGTMDAEDRLWFAEFGANRVAMLDTKTGAIKEWEAPTPWTAPYDAIIDKNAEIWTGGMTTDRVLRIDAKSGSTVEYPMPHDTNIRRVFVDNSATPVTFWAGSNHGAAIVKVEPLD